MPDIVEIAKERRKALAGELAKLDDFIQMAETLMKWYQSKASKAPETGHATVAGSSEPLTLRTGSAAGAT